MKYKERRLLGEMGYLIIDIFTSLFVGLRSQQAKKLSCFSRQLLYWLFCLFAYSPACSRSEEVGM
jgi:hypothetical protein